MQKMKRKMLTGTLLFGLGAAGIGMTAMAQPQGPGECGPGWRGGHGHYWQYDGAEGADRWREMAQQRMTELHGKLKLNPSQEKAWDDFQAVSTANMKGSWEYGRTDFSSMTAPQRMEKIQQLMKDREVRMAKYLEALKTFYATLTPEQQRIFDVETLPGRGARRYHDRSR